MKKLLVLILSTIFLMGCISSSIITTNAIYSISKMVKLSKDSVKIADVREMIARKELPSLDKFAKTYLKNSEENKLNAYYVYYDSLNNILFNVKENIVGKDTTYIIEKKLFTK